MKKLLALALFLGLGAVPAHAQQWFPGGDGSPVVCAYNASLPTLTATGQYAYAQCDIHGQLLISGGGGGGTATTPFLKTNTYTPITTGASSTPTTISAGAPTVVVAVNVGSTNGAFCTPGGPATTQDHYLASGGGWFAWNPNGATTLACIQSGGATTVNVTGGSGGLPTGSGGGGAAAAAFNGVITGPLGSQTTAAPGVSVSESGVPLTGSSLRTGGTGGIGWLSQIDADVNAAYDATTNSVRIIPTSNVTPTPCGSTITTGGTAQTLIAAATTIHGFTVANIDSSTGGGEPLWFSLTTTAAAANVGSYPLAAPAATTFAGMGSYTTPVGFGTNHAVSIIAANTGHKFTCSYW